MDCLEGKLDGKMDVFAGTYPETLNIMEAFGNILQRYKPFNEGSV